jgi:NAD(P)-dependent dehydrogenase (short-subunit alcohol dehydrogenase family)
MDLQLKGQTALVTGASKGIGEAVARELAREGCNLHLAARSKDQLDALARQLAADHGVKVSTHACDLSKSAEVQALAEAVGAPDVLVNNAGAIPGGAIQDIDEARWRASWDLKVFGYVGLTRALLPKMYARGSGAVVCVIGSAGLNPTPTYIYGCMANAALNMFVRALAMEAFDKGVRVCAVNPGATMSDRWIYLARLNAERRFGDPERFMELATDYPGKRPATCEEVAAAVAFFASPRSSYTAGAQITIDAGRGR